MDKTKLVIVNILVFVIGISLFGYKEYKKRQDKQLPPITSPIDPPVKEEPSKPKPNPQISVKMPPYLDYEKTVEQLKQWNKEAPRLTKIGTYGKSSRGRDLWYIRITGEQTYYEKPVVLITACIHGNEPLSASTVMCYIGTMLDAYGEDSQVTSLIDSRDIYFVPVVSPDSYPRSRHVDGVDPNRDFPSLRNPNKRSVPPVQALRDFFLRVKPKAVISGHTWGRVYLIPHGDTMTNCPNYDDYKPIMDKMKELSRYRWIRACDMYMDGGGLNNPPIRVWGLEGSGRPIYGTEVDWYYRNGAAAIVMEFGTHQRVPSVSDIQVEFGRTYKAVLHFVEKAPLMSVRSR